MASQTPGSKETEKKTLGQILSASFGEVGSTFVHLAKAPRALWGINISYMFEGLAYFGVLTILGKYLSEDVGMSDFHAGWVYSIFTGGITFAMLVLGGVSDRIGVRKALLVSLSLMVVGRTFLGASGAFFEHGGGAGSPMFITVLVGLAFVVVGYGMYQPAAYAGVKAFTNKKTAAIGFAMIYALMNLGAFFSGIISPPIRQATSMTGVYWAFVAITIIAFLCVAVILTRRVALTARERQEKDNAEIDAEEGKETAEDAEGAEEEGGETAENAEGAEEEEKKGTAEDAEGAEEEEEGTAESAEGAEEEEKKEAPKKRMLEPAAVIYAVLVLGGLIGFLYQTINAAKHPLTAAAAAHAGAAGKAVAAMEKQDGGAGEKALQASLTRLSATLAGAAEQARKDPRVDTARVSAASFTVATERITRDAEYLRALARTPDHGSLPKLDKTTTHRVRDVLRDHAVTTMAAAYGLALEGGVGQPVVNNLRLRMKEIDEEIIPMTPARVAQVAKLASLAPPQMLAAMGASIQRQARTLQSLLPGAPGRALALGLQAEQDYAATLSRKLQVPVDTTGRAVLQKVLMADSAAALNQARLLIAAVRTPNVIERMTEGLTEAMVSLAGADKKEEKKKKKSFAAVKVKSVLASYGDLGELLPRAAPLTTGQRVVSWLKTFGVFILPAFICMILLIRRLLQLRPDHPFHDLRFTFFIFVLIPVQTLFAHNWLTIPYYINRVFEGTTLGDNFEFFSNLNPILIFVLTPLIAALTARSDAYKMMIWGTLVMATPAFLLAFPPSPTLLVTYIVLMTIGEAMWQPRFLQIIAEIAPEGKTGAYMGIGQFPWFLTKLVTGMYSGWFVLTYVPRVGPQNSQFMWLIYAFVAMISPISLIMARKWMGAYLTKKHT